jgi:hypothetical protein
MESDLLRRRRKKTIYGDKKEFLHENADVMMRFTRDSINNEHDFNCCHGISKKSATEQTFLIIKRREN